MATVLKVNFHDSVHRVILPAGEEVTFETVRDILGSLHPKVVATAKYRDDEGDMCTLCAATFPDFLSQAGSANGRRVLKLELVSDAPTAAPAAAERGVSGLEDMLPLLKMAQAFLQRAMAWHGGHGGEHRSCKRRLKHLVLQLHASGGLNEKSAAALVVNSLPELISFVAERADKIDRWLATKEWMRQLLEGLRRCTAEENELREAAGKLCEALAGDGALPSAAILATLQGLDALPFDRQVAFVGAVFEHIWPELQRHLSALDAWAAWAPPAPMEHHGVVCDGCNMSPLTGLRFKNTCLPDYDLCTGCFLEKTKVDGGKCSSHAFELIPLSWHAHWHAGKDCMWGKGAELKGKGKCKGKGKFGKGKFFWGVEQDHCTWERQGPDCKQQKILQCKEYEAVVVPPGAEIVSAWYGSPTDANLRADVTEKVRSQYAMGNMEVRACNGAFGDPAWNVIKALQIVYTQEPTAAAAATATPTESQISEGQAEAEAEAKAKAAPPALVKEERGQEPTEVHYDIVCDGCEMHPLVGPRFTSKTLPDFDLCQACYASKGDIHGGKCRDHEFERVVLPAKGCDDGKGKCKGKGKGKGNCKGKGGPDAQPRHCAREGCNYQVTFHATHCCNCCKASGGHGPRCAKVEMPEPRAAAPLAEAPAIAKEGSLDTARTQPEPQPEPRQPSLPEPRAITGRVLLGDGNYLDMAWKETDDVQKVSQEFADQHGIGPENIPMIVAFVEQRNAAALEKPVGEAAKVSRDDEEGAATKRRVEQLMAMGVGSEEVCRELLDAHGGVEQVLEILCR